MLNPRMIIILLMLSSCVLIALIMLKYNWDIVISQLFERNINSKLRSRKNKKIIRNWIQTYGRDATIRIEITDDSNTKQSAMLTQTAVLIGNGFMGRLYTKTKGKHKDNYQIITDDDFRWDGILSRDINDHFTLILTTKNFKRL